MRTTGVRCDCPHAVLGLSTNRVYSENEIKEAFRLRVKTAHPDAGGNAEHFRELRSAYDTLVRKSNEPSIGGCTDSYNNAHSRRSSASCGADFSHSSSSDFHFSGADPTGRNHSTRHFYRPYTSDPFSHGFTAEELREAHAASRRAVRLFLLKHALLWGGLALCVCAHRREDRIARAVRARSAGYVDAEHWRQLREERSRGLGAAPQPHWTEARGAIGAAKQIGGSAFVYGGRPVAVSFQGRPFTASGVRGARTGVPKTYETFESDAHCDLDDEEVE